MSVEEKTELDAELAAEIEQAAETAPLTDEGIRREEMEEPSEDETEEQETEGRQDEEVEETEEDELTQETEDDSKETKDEKTTDTPTISNELIARAIGTGLTVEEARSFPSEQSLSSVCEYLERAQAAREQASQEVHEKEEKTEEREDKFSDILEKHRETFEPEALEVLDAMKDYIQAQDEKLHKLEKNQTQASQVSQEAAVRELGVWFNKAISGLGADFHDVLGVGDLNSLPQGSPELAKRAAILDEMEVAVLGCQAIGKPIPSREDLFDRATRLVLGDKYTQIRQKELQKKLKTRSKQHINRAGGGGKETTSNDPLEEIAAELDEKFGSP